MTTGEAVARPTAEKAVPFDSALEQVREELRWLSLRLRVVVERERRRRAVGPPDEYRGLYICDEEVDELLAPANGTTPPVADGREPAEAALALRGLLDERAAATASGGRPLPLDRVAAVFGLSPAERRALVVALAPHVDRAYEKVFAYANDDITRKRPTAGLTLDVLADDPAQALALRPLFFAGAPLVRHSLLRVVDEQAGGYAPLLSRFLDADPHVADVLLGFEGLDPRLHGIARLAAPAAPGDAGRRLARVLGGRGDARVYLGGRWDSEKQAAASAAAEAAGLRLLAVSVADLEAGEPREWLALLFRDARLLDAALYFDGWDARDDDSLSRLRLLMRPLLADHPLPAFFAGRAADPPELPLPAHLHLRLPDPSYADRRSRWLEAAGGAADEASLAQLAATFRLDAAQIRTAAAMGESIACWQDAAAPSAADLKTAARLQSQPRLTALAQKIEPRFLWEDIVLPADRLAQLREIAAQVLHQHVVYEEWAFGAKLSLGRGVAALFAGQSGTGKTMAAEIIARDLGLDLYKIDLSGLVSKWIGETEKNLARVFDEAADSSAILFFDEADAVFGKRTEVRDSHDRYANIEVSYLLQKMEEYDGIVVLASNLRANIDEAFLRRMRAIVEFPFPEEDDRLRIWQRTLSASAPLADDIDLPFLARRFRITGGNIRNIVLLAAFLAAAEPSAIGMTHLVRATKREFQKLGRLVTESDFGEWYDEVMA